MYKSIGFMGVLVLIGGCAAPSVIPQQLNPGAKESMTLIVPAKGVQIYECRSNKAGVYEWTFVAPEAELFDTTGNPIGKHYAGPSWEATDGTQTAAAVK